MALLLIPIATALWLKFKYRETNLVLIALISVGVMQGLCSNIAYNMGIDDLNWGQLKGALLIILFALVVLKIQNLDKKLPALFLIWSLIYLLFSLVIMLHILEAKDDNQTINTFNVVQNFPIINMLMVFISFFSYQKKVAAQVVDLIIELGKPISIIAILQWIIYKYFEIDTSLMMAARQFGTLNADDGAAIRVFSVFYTHYGLSAYLTLVTVLYVSRSLFKPAEFSVPSLGLFVVAHLLTFNLTGLVLTIGGCLFSMYIFMQNNNRLLLSKRTLIRVGAFGAFGVLLILLNPTLQQRITGIADYSDTSSGAGNSLYQRNIFIGNAIDVLSTSPNGLGLSLTDTSMDNYVDQGFARSGVINQQISADAWFLWLVLQIGLLYGGLMLLIYVVPLLRGLLALSTTEPAYQWQICAFTSILFVILLGALSNSTILNYPPSNIILWWSVGALFAIPKVRQTENSPK